MPYNLRKRKEPPAEEVPVAQVEKKPRGRAKKLKANEVDGEGPVVEVAPTPVLPEKKPVISETGKAKKVAPPKTGKAKRVQLKTKKELKAEEDAKTEEPAKTGEVAKIEEVDMIEEDLEDKKTEKAEDIAMVEKIEEKTENKANDVEHVEKVDKIEKATKKLKKTEESNQFVFGSDMVGELGLGKIGFDRKNPTPLVLKERAQQVACGGMHTITLTESGLVYSYGCNDDGALGRVTDGDETLEATPTLVDLKDKVTKVTAGDSHCAALTDKMEVFIWGNFRDENGMVGLMPECNGKATLKPTKVNLDKKLKDIASGANHMLLLDVDGVVYSFGVGDHGQLGRLKPEECATKLNAQTSKLFLTPKPVDLKNVDPQRPFVCDAIFAGEYTSFATNTDKKKNRLAGWGLNNYYQLGYKGLKGQLDQHYPRRCTFTCSTSMINVAGGQHHTIFLTKTGRVFAAGRHEYGMLGIGQGMQDKKEVCPARQVEGFDSPIKTICAGSRTSFAVSGEGKLYSWGMNSLNLGVEGDDDLVEPTLVKKLADRQVVSVSSGSITSVIVN